MTNEECAKWWDESRSAGFEGFLVDVDYSFSSRSSPRIDNAIYKALVVEIDISQQGTRIKYEDPKYKDFHWVDLDQICHPRFPEPTKYTFMEAINLPMDKSNNFERNTFAYADDKSKLSCMCVFSSGKISFYENWGDWQQKTFNRELILLKTEGKP